VTDVAARTLHELLRKSAVRHPDRPAVVDGPRELTYAELDAVSERIARQLTATGLRRGDRVGVHLAKSAEAIAGLYGALKAGACYVPLDPQAPAGRLRGIAADCEISALITDRRGATGPLADLPGLRAVLVPDLAATAPVEAAPMADSGPDDLAYVLYTSGSTGSPKGVMLTHGNGLAFVEWASAELDLSAEDRLSSHAPLHFDLSIFDLYAAAHAGAAVVLVPTKALVFPVDLAQFIRHARLTVWYSVPSALMLLLRQGALTSGCFPQLRAVLFAGEVFPTRALRSMMAIIPQARFINLYGPTETNVCTWYDVTEPPKTDAPVPIGRPTAGTTTLIVTGDGRPVAPGEAGELLVSGPTVMRGYWGDPDRTAQAFGLGPAGPPSYRTGDIVRRDDDGELIFLGRRDHQVKTRGYRVELAEIEATLHSHPAVAECAVIAVPDALVTNRLIACLVLAAPADSMVLARACRDQLPRYMVPERFEFFEALPRTSTDKIDRNALAAALLAVEPVQA
jgi:L-proline---[L-prolyl-carrier protein] ligase